MRVNIITKHSAYNFGAMLQAYALREKVSDLGAECSIIDLRQKKPNTLSSWLNSAGAIRNFSFLLHKNEILEGHKRFETFIDNYVKTERYDSSWDLRKDIPDADVYIAGSDQVWNPLSINDAFFLRFVPKEKIKASYAASMGISYIPEGTKSILNEYISDFDYISVREKTAKEMLSEITDKDVEVNVDPVFLLDENRWKELGKNPNLKKPYILCYVLYRPAWLNDWLRKLHKETGKQIVVVTSDSYRNIYHNKMIRNAGPLEFLGLLQNADFVVSTSFHGVALSIANKKPFYAAVNNNAPSRISDLLSLMKLEDRIITEKSDTVLKDLNYDETDKILESQREKSTQYLKKLIKNPVKAEKKQIQKEKITGNISIVGDKCTACTVCQNVCKADAITLKADSEGFLYPHVDEAKCVNCGLCLKKCHAVNEREFTKETSSAYYGWHKDEQIRNESTSGGAFSALAKKVTDADGLVIAAYFDEETKMVRHGSSDNIEFARFRKSKYVESEMGDTLSEIKNALSDNRQVLFCGTPCQCAGVRKMFGQNDNLIICDFLCHGVPSAEVFRDFLNLKESKAKKRITDYSFRTKDFGWSQYGIKVKYDNKKETKTVGRCEWFYVAAMLDDLFLRKSCYACDRTVYHESDITIADFWGVFSYKPELNDNKGISLIFTNTQRGEEILKSISEDFEVYPLEKKYVDYAYKVKTNDKKILSRNKEFDEYKKVGISNYINKKYRLRMIKYKTMFAMKKHKLRRK